MDELIVSDSGDSNEPVSAERDRLEAELQFWLVLADDALATSDAS